MVAYKNLADNSTFILIERDCQANLTINDIYIIKEIDLWYKNNFIKTVYNTLD